MVDKIDFSRINALLEKELTPEMANQIPNTIIVVESAETPNEEISNLHRQVVTELNAHFLFHGKYLTLSELKEKVDLTTLTPVGLKDLFEKVSKTLIKRGLPAYGVKFTKAQLEFDPEFIGACTVLADFTDKRPLAAKLKEIGITTKTWNGWLKIQRNYDYWHRIVDGIMDREVFEEGRLALAQNVARGDLSSFKYFNEMTDKFTAQREFDPRIIGVLMSGVLDIIMRHVDGTVAAKIAEEIQGLGIASLSGGGVTIPIEANSTVVNLD